MKIYICTRDIYRDEIYYACHLGRWVGMTVQRQNAFRLPSHCACTRCKFEKKITAKETGDKWRETLSDLARTEEGEERKNCA